MNTNHYKTKTNRARTSRKRRGPALRILFLIGLLVAAQAAWPRTKLTTLPNRQAVRIDLKTPDLALVEEERTINLQKGRNHIEFAWANTHIQKESIRFRPIKTPGRVNVLNVNFPPGETALFWECHATEAGPAVFRISYLMGNIQRGISYEAVADRAEKNLVLKTFFNLRNQSGEHFANAKLELTFGKGFRRTLRLGEGRKVLAATHAGVPITKSYRFDEARLGKFVRMFYEIKNDSSGGLGGYDLPAGKVRIFQTDSAGTQAFLGEDWGAPTPILRTMSLYLGQAKEVQVKRTLTKNAVEWVNRPVHHTNQTIRFEIDNFKDGAVPLSIWEHPGGEWEISGVTLKELKGERNARTETEIKHEGVVRLTKKDINNLLVEFQVPPTRERNIKYVLYLDVALKNRW